MRIEEGEGIVSFVCRSILHRPDQCQDRPRGRRGHGVIRVPATELDDTTHLADRGLIALRERFLERAKHLRQDHSAVAPRPHERAVCRGRADRRERRVRGARGLERRAHRVEHVRAGIAVRYRIDIERVDFIDSRLEARCRGLESTQQCGSVELLRDGRDCIIALTSA